MPKERIQKVLSDAGVASRRRIEQMIVDGKITVNGELVTELPCFIDPEQDRVEVGDQVVSRKPTREVYFLLNKPRGVIAGPRDVKGRPVASDLVGPRKQNLYAAPPLDADSTGLVIVTSDGKLIQKITHARYPGPVCKYVAEVEGKLDAQAVEELKAGVRLDKRKTRGAYVRVIRSSPQRSMIELDLIETVSREPRRILAKVGHKVRRLKRVGLNALDDRGLKIGNYRTLDPREAAAVAEGPAKPPPKSPRTAKQAAKLEGSAGGPRPAAKTGRHGEESPRRAVKDRSATSRGATKRSAAPKGRGANAGPGDGKSDRRSTGQTDKRRPKRRR